MSAADLLTAARIAEIHCKSALGQMIELGDAERVEKALKQLEFVRAAIATATESEK